MRCDARVIEVERKKRGKPYPAVKLIALNGGIGIGEYADPTTITSKTQECGGRVIASVRAVEEPEWGGVICSLEITYTCDRCGSTYFHSLPHDEKRLSEVLQMYVDALGPQPLWSPPSLTAEELAQQMGIIKKLEG